MFWKHRFGWCQCCNTKKNSKQNYQPEWKLQRWEQKNTKQNNQPEWKLQWWEQNQNCVFVFWKLSFGACFSPTILKLAVPAQPAGWAGIDVIFELGAQWGSSHSNSVRLCIDMSSRIGSAESEGVISCVRDIKAIVCGCCTRTAMHCMTNPGRTSGRRSSLFWEGKARAAISSITGLFSIESQRLLLTPSARSCKQTSTVLAHNASLPVELHGDSVFHWSKCIATRHTDSQARDVPDIFCSPLVWYFSSSLVAGL